MNTPPVPAATAADLARIVQFNRTEATFPDDVTLQELIEARSDKHASAIAVICDHDQVFGVPSLTFAELNEKVNQLAHLLRAEGVRPGETVALMVERSFAMIVGILGIVKAGGAYLPLPPDNPPDRIDYMWELLRVNKETAADGRLPDWSWLVLGYSLFTWSTIRLMPTHLPEPDAIVCALVYLIFAMLFRIRMGAVTWGESIFLGVLLGLGYLTKAIMFPMAFVFTGVAVMLVGRSAKKLSKILVAFSVFLLLSLPYIVVLSQANARWMFSDAGRLNYAWRHPRGRHR